MTMAPITGRKVFVMFALAFGVIISVNLLLAYKAVTTFPGLEVKNSYVASQTFDAERDAQLALGWDVVAKVYNDVLTLSFHDAQGVAVEPVIKTAVLGRATHVGEDQTPAFAFDGDGFVSPVFLNEGNWNLRVTARAANGTLFRQRIPIYVSK